MRLKTIFLLLSLLLALTVATTSTAVILNAWREQRQAARGGEALHQLRAVLVAAELASRERGPSNASLGEDPPGTETTRQALGSARVGTDAAFEQLQTVLSASDEVHPVVQAQAAAARQQLGVGRAAVDRVAAQRRADRASADVQQAVQAMIAVIDQLAPAMSRLANDAALAAPSAADAIKGTPLEGASIYLGGSAAMYNDMQIGADYDLMIVAAAALILIFIIMLVLTRAVVASAVIVGTVVLSLASAFGLSVLLWQHIVGIPLHWMVLPMSVIVLLAVGADYNLLLVSRIKEEIHAGLNTGIIRAMVGTGSVVTSAGLVFAATMASFVFADLRVLGQIGTTIALGLLFDTLIVRSFMTPAIAVLLGRWFWWPLKVRPRPASQMLQPYGSRQSVRQLLLWEDGDPAVSGSVAGSRSHGGDA